MSIDDESCDLVSTENIVRFSRLLRDSGLDVSPAETIDATSAVALTRPVSLQHLARVLRVTLIKSGEDYDCFEKSFNRFWRGQLFSGPSITTTSVGQLRKKLAESVLVTKPDDHPSVTAAPQALASSYSPFENFATKRFIKLDAQRGLTVQRNVLLLASTLALRVGVRYRRSARGQLDLRSTIRRSFETQGEILGLAHRERKWTNGPIVVFCDVSGSMDTSSEALLTIIHAIQNCQRHVETFIFSTELMRVTKWLLASSLSEAARQISARAQAWGSGTKIGVCLSTALTNYLNLLRNDTLTIIISDGWDVGDLDLLKRTMELLRSRVGALVWINPWADETGFQIGSSGLRTALPYVDMHIGPAELYDRRKLLVRAARIAPKLSLRSRVERNSA
jgi:uncharacterized protein with von Willebrand factor type A (vWA) domain